MNTIDQQSPNAFIQVLRGGTAFGKIHVLLAAAMHWPLVTLWLVFMDNAFPPIGGQHTSLIQWAPIGAIVPLYFTIDALMRMKRQGTKETTLAPAGEAIKAAIVPGICVVTAAFLAALLTLGTSLIAAHPAIAATLWTLFSAGALLAPSALFFHGLVYASTRMLRAKPKPTA